MNDISMIQLGQSLMAVSDSFDDLAHRMSDRDVRFVQVTDAVTGKQWGVRIDEVTLFRPAMQNEYEQIAQVRAQNSGIALPGTNIAMPQGVRQGGVS